MFPNCSKVCKINCDSEGEERRGEGRGRMGEGGFFQPRCLLAPINNSRCRDSKVTESKYSTVVLGTCTLIKLNSELDANTAKANALNLTHQWWRWFSRTAPDRPLGWSAWTVVSENMPAYSRWRLTGQGCPYYCSPLSIADSPNKILTGRRVTGVAEPRGNEGWLKITRPCMKF